ncbi:amino acid adenylation domain-containing protein [Biomphalaria pfeifferi]|uniref:Amino acid adenylation domain-containing protein n=1 Tax=Biomphalaria pfeifferi TaxID=112525 RepID=A0AAD8ETQ9_BIOPF|nr:amino acid adenylation domain-containing protein [Biomphalaria pfeifferi]
MKWSQLLSELNARSVQLSASEDELIIRAPEGNLSPEMWQYIAHYKSSLLKLLRDDSQDKTDGKAAQVVPQISERFKPFPLTPIQQVYWLGRSPSFELGRVGIHVYEELDCRNLDLTRLNQAWQSILKRHEMLRVVVLPDGQQQILPEAEYPIEILDLREFETNEQQIRLEKLRRQLVQKVYDPLQFPLFTICACRLNEEKTRLFISIDALHVDMGSFAILFGEWSMLYEDPTHDLPPLTLSYRDYALTVEGFRHQESFRRAQSYWQSRAAQLHLPPALPYTKAFSEITKQTFVRYSGRLEQAQWQKLKQRAAAAGVTPSGITLSAMVEVLARWSQEQRFTLNVTLFNRLPIHPEVNKIVGDFTSMIPLPIDCRADGASFAERAASWQKLVWEGLDHRIVSGIEVLREYKRSQQQTQLGQLNLPVVFTSTLNLSQQGVLPLKKFGERIFNRIQTPQVSLDLQVYEEDGDLIFNWDGVKELFPPETLEQMFGAYRNLLEKLADETDVWNDSYGEIVSVPQSESRLSLNQTGKPLVS